MNKHSDITVPRWFLEIIEDTLRIEYNFRDPLQETCQDRNIKECLNGTRKLLNGEELTGGERLESLKASSVDKKYSVFYKDSEEINDHYLSISEAIALARSIEEDGYEVIIAKLVYNDDLGVEDWKTIYMTGCIPLI